MIGGKNKDMPPNREIGGNPKTEFAVRDSQPETAIELNVKGLTKNPPVEITVPFPPCDLPWPPARRRQRDRF